MTLEAREPHFDRPFEDIFAELRSRIPRYSAAWTNFNDSDPGITLLQLFAWLAELTLHKMGDVPRKNYLKFAKLLGLELNPALPAEVALTFAAKPAQRPATIPEGSKYSAEIPGQGALVFETSSALDVIGAPLSELVVVADGTVTKIAVSDDGPTPPFFAFGRDPQPGDALYLAFKPNPGNPTPFPGKLSLLALRPEPDNRGRARLAGEDDADLVPPVELAWEYLPSAATNVWERLNVFDDGSVAFTRDGFVAVEGPSEIEPVVEPGLDVDEARYWLRVRLDQNTYPEGAAPRLEHFLPNSVMAVNLTTGEPRTLGTSSGRGGQWFDFPKRPIDADSIALEVRTGNDAEAWTRVEDLRDSKPRDKHFVLNSSTGRVSFGDGLHGDIPALGADIFARRWRSGGGAAGNLVAPRTVTTMLSQIAGIEKVTNARAAAGGADEQSVEDFIAKAPAQLKAGGRAVTAADFEAIALEIGGVKQARALANRHPDFPEVDVAGAITVYVVPDSTALPPYPSAELVRAVAQHFDRRRLLTSEVYVAGPKFLEIRVEARLLAAPEAAFDQVSFEARKRLNTFLDPLLWKFGKDLSTAAIYRELFGDPDQSRVHSVSNLVVYVDGNPLDASRPLSVPGDTLVYPGNHLIVVRPDRDQEAGR